ncbi:MAG: hypothetical protein II685_08345 [Clostridia bacterium]|nr:hypothetical protein [Clostridia bacterium]
MKTWVKRAIRTFIQAAVGYLAVALPTIDFEGDGVKAALIGIGVSSVSAGLAAIMNIKEE